MVTYILDGLYNVFIGGFMFKSILLSMLVLVSITVSANEPDNLPTEAVVVWVDPFTGCEYVTLKRSGTVLTPRLQSNGKPLCRRNGRIVVSDPN